MLTSHRLAKRLVATMLVLGIGVVLSGCVVVPGRGRPGWCYWHPYRCR